MLLILTLWLGTVGIVREQIGYKKNQGAEIYFHVLPVGLTYFTLLLYT